MAAYLGHAPRSKAARRCSRSISLRWRVSRRCTRSTAIRASSARSWPKPLDAVITEQVREPQTEARLRAAMPRLTAIADPVSQQVRQQYEENPYPRWVTVAPTRAGREHIRPPARAVSGRAAARRRGACGARYPGRGLRHRTAADRHGAAFPAGARAGDRSEPREPCLCASASPMPPASQIEYAQADILALAPDRQLRHDRGERRAASPGRPDARLGDAAQPAQAGRRHAARASTASSGARDVVALQREFVAERRLCARPSTTSAACRQDLLAKPDPRFAPILRLAGLLQHQRLPRPAVPRAGASADACRKSAHSWPSTG